TMATQPGLPPPYLGYATDNPASAGAISSTAAQLVQRAERKQTTPNAPWAQRLRLALLRKMGRVADRARRSEAVWRNAATPTMAAQTDAAVKLVQTQSIPSESEVALEMVGLSEAQRQRVRADRRRTQARQVLAQIAGRDDVVTADGVAGTGA